MIEHEPDGETEKITEEASDGETSKTGKRKLRVNFKGRLDDPPEDGDSGVREPRKPDPRIDPGGAELSLPGSE